MTNAIATIALLSPPAVDPCKAFTGFGFWWAKAFIIAAFVVAIVETLIVIAIKIIQAVRGKGDIAKLSTDDAATKFLEALKGVLVALAGLPAWVTIYLAGLALLWVAGHPGSCPI